MKGVSTQKTMNLTGIYSGVDYSSTYLEVTESPNNNSSQKPNSNTYKVYPNSKKKEKNKIL